VLGEDGGSAAVLGLGEDRSRDMPACRKAPGVRRIHEKECGTRGWLGAAEAPPRQWAVRAASEAGSATCSMTGREVSIRLQLGEAGVHVRVAAARAGASVRGVPRHTVPLEVGVVLLREALRSASPPLVGAPPFGGGYETEGTT
jgi:hypothetical protein